MNSDYDVIIIGAGCTGYGAALYSGRFELKTLIIGEVKGGTIIQTNDVANYPGFKQIDGFELATKLEQHALDYSSVSQKEGKVIKLEKIEDLFKVYLENGENFTSKTVILATGTEWKQLGVPGEKEYTGKGIHYCALCDGGFYKNKKIVVVGGGDSAVKESNLLSTYGSEVIVLVRKDVLKGEPVNVSRALKNPKIKFMYNVEVKEIYGDGKKANKCKLYDNKENTTQDFNFDGMFIEIGHNALSDLAKQLGVQIDSRGEVIIDRHGFTNVEGFFAAGDVVDTNFKQAITGVAEGVTASYNAYEYIEKKFKN
ncbi:Dihydrolipoyl dehydrogenase [uncultured archaeon]|nr:Dihydrolipoyl dehydrogenase [uncultured archaeon]